MRKDLPPVMVLQVGGESHRLYQIQAVRYFGTVEKGDFGGYIESEANLSHEGTCWVEENAQVYGNARVSGNAQVRWGCICDNARVCDNAKIEGDYISDFALIFGDAYVQGSHVCGHACIFGEAHVKNSEIYDCARVYGEAWVGTQDDFYGCRIYGNAEVFENAWVQTSSVVCENARMYGCAKLNSCSCLYGEAILRGNAEVYHSDVYGHACVEDDAYLIDRCFIHGGVRLYGMACLKNVEMYGSLDFCGNLFESEEDIVLFGCYYLLPFEKTKEADFLLEDDQDTPYHPEYTL